MSRLMTKFNKEIRPQLKKELGLKNELAVPRLEAITVTIGTSRAQSDDKFLAEMRDNLAAITGQHPANRPAKRAISNFKIREGMTVSMQVTLRGQRMYDFLDRLINITLPRTRDFRGLSLMSFDGQGNYSLGFKEQAAFAEVKADQTERVHGLGITIKTTSGDQKEGQKLLEAFGFPFSREKKKRKKKNKGKRAFLSQDKGKKSDDDDAADETSDKS